MDTVDPTEPAVAGRGSWDADRASDAPLAALRRRVERLAGGGRYGLRCERTGDRPVPVRDARFEDLERARRALELVRVYRRRLRAYDPWLPEYDLAVVALDGEGGRVLDLGGAPESEP